MPITDFASLPADSRVWIFASDRPLGADEATMLLEEVDRFLDQWKAHGAPLRCAREWRDDRFLAIGVDPTVEQASGCSIDGLFRGLQKMERALGTGLVAGGRVFYRDDTGAARLAPRKELPALFERGDLSEDTAVFDTSLTSVRDWREGFVRPARDSWVASLLRGHASHSSNRSATNSSSSKKG
jgi:hypothetical protein